MKKLQKLLQSGIIYSTLTILFFGSLAVTRTSWAQDSEEKKVPEREVVVSPAPVATAPQRAVVVRPAPQVAAKATTATTDAVTPEAIPGPQAEAPSPEPVAATKSAVAPIVEAEKTEAEKSSAPLGPGAEPKKAAEGEIAVSDEADQNIVSDIEIKGNQIIASGTIINKIKIRRGDPLVQETINEDIKRLYASGFFQDIKVDVLKEGAREFRLIFTVDEKPLVRQIIIQGNVALQENKLRKEIKLIEGQILDPKAVKEGVVAIRNLYLNKGFKFVEVKSETDVNENTKEAILYILIDEGQKFRIKSVQFEGNSALKSSKLKRLMRTRARNLLLLKTGVFHEDHFENDLEKIRSAYQQAGYADVKVEPRFDYDREVQQMNLIIQIDEGQIYHAGDIRIQGNVLFPESELWEVLTMLPGDIYSQFALNEDLAAIQRFYFYQGYIAAQVDPEIQFNRDTGKVDVSYAIHEGDLFFVNKVKIRGNTKTKDMVIRRELRIRPGEKFDGEKIDRSKERLEGLNYFEEVAYESEDTEEAEDANQRDLIFKVKEKQTGQLSFGGGVSSIETLIGFAEVSQNNFDLFNWPTFTGGGQSISLQGRLGTQTRDVSFSFTEPYIFNKPYSYSIQLYDTRRNTQNTPWDEERIGASNTFGHKFTEYTSVAMGITAERVKLTDVASDASPQILANGETNNLFKLRPTIAHDTRNNPLNPVRGHLISFSPEFVMGDSAYYSAFINLTKYWTLFKTHVLETRFRIGGMEATGSNAAVPVFDRYFAGGLGSVRGFGFRRVGPLDGPAGEEEPVGGQSMVIQNIDYTFPIINNFKGVVFIDIARVGAEGFEYTEGDIAMSAGPGLKVNTPIGPMLFYYGVPVANADVENKNGRFEFSIARAF